LLPQTEFFPWSRGWDAFTAILDEALQQLHPPEPKKYRTGWITGHLETEDLGAGFDRQIRLVRCWEYLQTGYEPKKLGAQWGIGAELGKVQGQPTIAIWLPLIVKNSHGIVAKDNVSWLWEWIRWRVAQ
jgi:hypothetical protein